MIESRSVADDIAVATEVVSEVTGVLIPDIRGPSRLGEIAWARHVACYAARVSTRATLKAIGEYMNGRDHSTVVNAIRRVSADREIYPDLDEIISFIEAETRRRLWHERT